jgi:hypothetical protein
MEVSPSSQELFNSSTHNSDKSVNFNIGAFGKRSFSELNISLTVHEHIVACRALLCDDCEICEYTGDVPRQRLGTHVTAGTNRRATIEVLLETGCYYVVRAEELLGSQLGRPSQFCTGVSVKNSEYNFHKYKFVRLSTPFQFYDRATVKIKQRKRTNFVDLERRTTKEACKKWNVHYVTTKFRPIAMLCNSWQRKIHKMYMIYDLALYILHSPLQRTIINQNSLTHGAET